LSPFDIFEVNLCPKKVKISPKKTCSLRFGPRSARRLAVRASVRAPRVNRASRVDSPFALAFADSPSRSPSVRAPRVDSTFALRSALRASTRRSRSPSHSPSSRPAVQCAHAQALAGRVSRAGSPSYANFVCFEENGKKTTSNSRGLQF